MVYAQHLTETREFLLLWKQGDSAEDRLVLQELLVCVQACLQREVRQDIRGRKQGRNGGPTDRVLIHQLDGLLRGEHIAVIGEVHKPLLHIKVSGELLPAHLHATHPITTSHTNAGADALGKLCLSQIYD